MAQTTNEAGFAAELSAACHNFVQDWLTFKYLLDRYQQGGLQEQVAALATNDTLLPGTPYTKETMIQAITFVDLILKMTENEPIPQGLWKVGMLKAAALHGVEG